MRYSREHRPPDKEGIALDIPQAVAALERWRNGRIPASERNAGHQYPRRLCCHRSSPCF